MFKRLPNLKRETVTLSFEGEAIEALVGDSIAAALLAAGVESFRSSPVSGASRAPHCLMGACFECLVEVDGIANRQACLTTVEPGMAVRRQVGAPVLDISAGGRS
ncbi:MAG: (2Fe-2S)-binding protein [Rhodospirillaceae bacterium]|jgi:D-hydroxyproline dehydrogenase subunit gamma|nr:(2Fe-2S)-binding protein [Rhodospirillaceae bacterium]